MKKLLLTGIALGALVTADFSMAADVPVYLKAPPVAPWSWTGFYLGGNVGYSWGRASTDFTETSTTTSVVTATTRGGGGLPGNGLTTTTVAAAAGSASSDMNGWLGGGQAGYNWQTDQWVFGLEGDIQATGQTDDPTFCGIPGCPVGSAIGTSTTKLPWFGTLRGRAGHTWDPGLTKNSLFLYVTGGLAVGEIDSTYTGGVVGGPIGAVSTSATRAGWVVGGGAEGRLGQSNWTLKLEYLFMDFGSVSGDVAGAGAPVITPFGINNADQIHFITTTTVIAGAASTHVTDQVVRVGLNYRMGGGGGTGR
jgi:outer membrane immunogenic protein